LPKKEIAGRQLYRIHFVTKKLGRIHKVRRVQGAVGIFQVTIV
jgi:hypothetical protein